MSGTSSALIEEGLSLLNLKSSLSPNVRPVSPDLLERATPSPDFGLSSHTADGGKVLLRNVCVLAKVRTPKFKRIDFDDRLEDLNPNKPAWKSWQENIKDSYNKAKVSAEKKREENEFMENMMLGRPRPIRGESPYRNLSMETGFIPSVRSRSSVMGPSLADRSRLATSSSYSNMFNGKFGIFICLFNTLFLQTAGSGPYAAPALSISQGIESRYEERANNVELMLLKTASLPERYKTITTREFRKAPDPSAGSYSEKDDYDFSHYTTARPYYSRPNRDDPDYFDFDLQHSVDMFKRPEGKYTPRRPQEWENKLISESASKGTAPLSGHMFTKPDVDWRNNGTSYLSAALRTPKFWEQRFENIGKHVRDSNPISLESINRNRPVTSRFTDYQDPDYDDYEDPLDD
ncbi:Protein CBR-UNC-96 [Caenorhabditis briggsae]|uniref:Protein CBR-UNC-96 n=1 Tax=Caenorhabditis briggsae TaxID=6238 RepID=A8X5W8_CAEBR|nr:Protein CBR-UNC-96 [Caenorhabditis briggsae]CAP28029.2 Protein CBR-UNC-96 [Caenorhabditis briggsae]